MTFWESVGISAGVAVLVMVGSHFVTVHVAVKKAQLSVPGKPGGSMIGPSRGGTVARSTPSVASPNVTAAAIISGEATAKTIQKV
jgi:hypothetical protein